MRASGGCRCPGEDGHVEDLERGLLRRDRAAVGNASGTAAHAEDRDIADHDAVAGGGRNPAGVADAATEGCGVFHKDAGCAGADRALGDDLAPAVDADAAGIDSAIDDAAAEEGAAGDDNAAAADRAAVGDVAAERGVMDVDFAECAPRSNPPGNGPLYADMLAPRMK